MATSNAVWGIDIGQCALKALRCTLADDGQTLQADAFDYIEYPKILTQPDANPEQLIQEALQKFLANNSVRDSRVAISVSGQSGLARFIKLPPVEAKKIPDIVKYEAKQQIPFSLDDVIWDYEPLLGGMQDDGVALETEVGLFAMKREQVFRALRPFRDAGIELDIVQLTPICIYNAVTYGVLTDLPSPSDYDPEDPPKSVVVISMGTDTTDLVVTNGFRIWQRSIPIGGSHFTKQLTKEMKLTFAKAEHLKRNAREAEDPKAVFQAMRPVFNDLVQELQRSIGYFRSIDRRAQIAHGVVLGNAMRLPGLQPYIEKNLEIPIKKVQEFEHLTGPSVISTPKFKDNLLSFAVSYGLCIQGLGKSRLSTNLIPRELVTSRLIRHKKPWALLALTLFMLGVGFNFLLLWNRWREAHPDRFKEIASDVKIVSNNSSQFINKDSELQQQFDKLKKLGDEVVGGADARFMVLELLKTINVAMPREEGGNPYSISKTAYLKRPELFVESIDSEYFPALSEYCTPDVRERHVQFLKDLNDSKSRAASTASPDGESTETTELTEGAPPDAAEAAVAAEETAQDDAATPEPELPSFERPGWVIEIKGFHFHNDDPYNQKSTYVMTTLLNSLENGSVQLPAGPNQPLTEFTMKELGVYCPIIAADGRDISVAVPNPDYKPGEASPGTRNNNRTGGRTGISLAAPGSDSSKSEFIARTAYEFTVQFMWIETRASQRLEARRQSQTPTVSDEVAGRILTMDQLREFIGLLKRQHFWFLAPVLLAMGLAGWWLSSKKLSTEFDNNKKVVTDYFTDMQRVKGEQRHPNQDFHDGMETLIQQRRENVRAAWQTKWERQKQELKWPEELPPDFRRQVEQMRPIEKVDPENNPEQELPRTLRLTYGGFIKKVLPQLAASIGSRWRPARTGTARTFQGFGTPSRTTGVDDPDVRDESQIVDWSPTNQGLFDERFDWGTRSPSTREVLYAQEDLWVLSTLIDIIRRTNRDALTRAQAPVKAIDFLQIAKEVQVPNFRVLRPAPLTSDESSDDDLLDSRSDEPTADSRDDDPTSDPDGGEQGQTPDALALLVQNRYVNENYEPIADLETLFSSVTVAKRIPVRMRLKIDERQIHRLLAECANSPLTFEVRQLRLNPQGDNMGGGSSFRGSGDSPQFERSQGPAGIKTLPDYQTFVRTVELFGIVYIFNPVDEAILGGTQPENLAADLGSSLPR